MTDRKVKNVLLLNPPGKKRYLRDYYCSHISKGKYYWHPYDLLALSGILSRKFNIEVVDSIALGWDRVKTSNYILNKDFHAIIFLSGAVSWREDFSFLDLLKKKRDYLVAGSGDIFLENTEKLLLGLSFLDAVIMDFTNPEISDFLEGNNGNSYASISFKKDSQVVSPAIGSKDKRKEFSMPIPRHEMLPLRRYALPHVKSLPFASVLTAFGCPFTCSFCPFEKIDYRKRNLENLYEELIHIKKMRIKELWVKDQTFGADRGHSYAICNWLIKEKMHFDWSCETRVDVVDEEFLALLKKAGCHTVMFGVESANEEVLNKYKKKITREQIRSAFYSAKKLGLKTLAHFMLGLPGESKKSQEELIDFAGRLDPDFASFNIITPQPNTTFKDEALAGGLISNRLLQLDSSNSFPVMGTDSLTPEDIWGFRNKALRKFYLRPAYLIKRVSSFSSFRQVILHVNELFLFLISLIKR